jgi:DNA-binding transcriptional MocR family regulator
MKVNCYIVIMTMWSPSLAEQAGPKCRALVDALAEDIKTGQLEPGARLPTHRELADRLGIAIGTVSRAYALAQRRGLITGEIGRGTFVSFGVSAASAISVEGEEPSLIDLSKNRIARDLTPDRTLAETLTALAARSDLAPLLDDYQPAAGAMRHRAAGAAWISRMGLEARPERTLVCSGAQHAMFVALSVLTRPGDTIFTEQLTYPGIKALASLLHLTLHGLPLDEHGLRVDAFEAACRASSAAKVLYCVPTLHNPTASVMPEARRREIASVAERHHVTIIEDDVYGVLPTDAPPPIASHAPEHSFYIASTSKSLSPGLRIGYLAAPAEAVDRAAAVIRTTTWEATPLMAEIVTTWIEDGTVDRILEWKREETAARQEMARGLLGGYFNDSSSQMSCHVWLQLPEPWRSADFVAQARTRGVVVTPSEAFVAGRLTSAPHAVRLCLGSPRSRQQLEKGLEILADILRDAPEPTLTVT